jgi:hypothetical protein
MSEVIPFKPLPATPAAVRWAVREALKAGAKPYRVLAAARAAAAGKLPDRMLLPICEREWDCLFAKRRVQP